MLDLKKDESIKLCLEKTDSNIINIGLGWDTRSDLDVHAVLRDSKGEEIETVYYGNKRAGAVRLSGDNLTGEGDGDDEIIYIDKKNLNKKVATISIYVNIYSGASSFKEIDGGYIRIYEDAHVLAKSNLDIDAVKNFKAIHFADLDIKDNFNFKIIMNGGIAIRTLINDYNAKAFVSSPKEEINTVKKRKKFLGLF